MRVAVASALLASTVVLMASLTGCTRQETVAPVVTPCHWYDAGQLGFFKEGESAPQRPCDPVKPGVVYYKCDSETNKCTSTGARDSVNLYKDWDKGKVGKGCGISCSDGGCSAGFHQPGEGQKCPAL